jgi:magnesium-transporting ATPase (P-type)
VGGKLDVVCFDKTGTLTEDGLDVLGLRIMNEQQRFGFAPQSNTLVADDLQTVRSRVRPVVETVHGIERRVSAMLGEISYDCPNHGDLPLFKGSRR